MKMCTSDFGEKLWGNWTFSGTDSTVNVVVEYTPDTSSETLTGTPSGYFNSPGRGQTLVGTFPVPASGKTFEASAQVNSTAGGTFDLPIAIRRN